MFEYGDQCNFNEQQIKCDKYKEKLPLNKWIKKDLDELTIGQIIYVKYCAYSQLKMYIHANEIGKIIKIFRKDDIVYNVTIINQNKKKVNIIKDGLGYGFNNSSSYELSIDALSDIPIGVVNKDIDSDCYYVSDSEDEHVLEIDSPESIINTELKKIKRESPESIIDSGLKKTKIE